MPDDKRIPLAWPIRWRRIRQQIFPVGCFVLAVWFSGWLWEHRGSAVHGVGEVEARRIEVTSPSTAVVTDFAKPDGSRWQAFDYIRAGDLLLRLTPLSVDENQQRTDAIEIRAPLTGTIAAIHCASGQAVAPGRLLVTIAADTASHVISYLPEESRLKVGPGLPVTLRSRTSPTTRIVTQIESVGGQIARVPMHQNGGPTTSKWGLPVRIRLPENSPLKPGALVDVVFQKKGSGAFLVK